MKGRIHGMGRNHEVNVMVRKPGGKVTVLSTRKCHLREWMIRWLFGEAREILVLNPGETVSTIAIKEIQGE